MLHRGPAIEWPEERGPITFYPRGEGPREIEKPTAAEEPREDQQ